MTRQVYLELMHQHMTWLADTFMPEERRGFIWLQDSAPAHSPNKFQSFLEECRCLWGKFVRK